MRLSWGSSQKNFSISKHLIISLKKGSCIFFKEPMGHISMTLSIQIGLQACAQGTQASIPSIYAHKLMGCTHC